ncbi:MAG: response regulator [Gemmataceae bacterium]|nr:response regulator [Gemmataceae bacterium]
MPPTNDDSDTILIVDDEEPVRRTFREWLEQAGLDCRLLTAADAEAALVQANQQTIDLAILDWNLGAGNDGLHLLEDLYLFNPEVVAILITGYAHQATPLDAMRMGVRDYLDKNQDLDRATFLAAVRRQLERIRPAKRERRLHQSLVAFREAVEKVLPLVQAAAALHDPLPLPEAVASLFQFLLRTTQARDGVLLVRHYDPEQQPAETCRVYDAEGKLLAGDLVPFARSVAGTAVSLQEPCLMNRFAPMAAAGNVQLQPFERGRQSLLAAPMTVAPGIQAVMELFDKQTTPSTAGEFTPEDRRLVAAAADFGAEMLRQALAERQTQRVLFDAVAAALTASDSVAAALRGNAAQRMEEPPPAAVLEQLRAGLSATPGAAVDAEETLRLVEAIRVLARRHGPTAVNHCIHLVESLRELLDTVTGETRNEER